MRDANFLNLFFSGISVKITGDTGKIPEDIKRDFSFFSSPRGRVYSTIVMNIHATRPIYSKLPPMRALYLSPRNVCYYHNGIKYIDYQGNALIVYDKNALQCDIHCDDDALLHEICYKTILSLVSEGLDNLHIHRVHGLGLAIGDKAVLLLLDMGGGKTTLAINLLSVNNGIRLISEDSPLIDKEGNILPFPVRIGVRPTEVPSAVPKEYQRYFAREEFGPKTLIDIEYFKDRICDHACRPYMIIIGRRVLGMPPAIKSSVRYEAVKEFMKNSVIGIGLYQGIEYVFQKGPSEVIKKIPLGFSRLVNSLKVIRRSKVFELSLGQDTAQNILILTEFLKKQT